MMEDVCFIIVDGLTKSLSSSEEGHASVQLLQQWFPKSHCHLVDPFEGLSGLPPRIDALEELSMSMLKSLLRCPECSTTYLTCQKIGQPPRIHRPFVFVGHDVGGSIIKKALMLATEDSLSRSIVDATVAVFFFGGLHRAPDLDSWGRLFARLLTISKRNIQVLLPWLLGLTTAQASISPAFFNMAGSYAVFNVYEESDAATIPKFSATLESLGPDQFGAQRCHTELLDLKQGDRTSKWLIQRLRSLDNQESTLRHECRAFIRYVARSEPKHRQLRTQIPSPASLQCINSLKSYNAWAQAPGISFLHVYGPPGSGATILTSNVVWLFGDSRREMKVTYLDYSFGAQSTLASSEEMMMYSLVRQILSQLPHLFKHARSICAWIMERRCANVETLWALLQSLLLHIGRHQVVLITIRAAQECSSPGGCTIIIKGLLGLRKSHNLNVKVVFTSQGRDWATEYPGIFNQVSMEEVKVVNLDLKDLVRDRLQQLLSTRPAWRDLVDTVADRFWGEKENYYWALAKVQELESVAPTILSTGTALMETVRSFPDDEREFFRYVVQRIPRVSAAWLLEALRWLVFALRPLTSRELAVAVAFYQSKSNRATKEYFESVEESTLSDLPGDINRTAGYWVKTDFGIVAVTNTTLKSFLVDNLLPDSSREHSKILKGCLEYIRSARITTEALEDIQGDTFEPSILDLPGCDLLEYAALHWPFHCRETGEGHSEAIDEAQTFIEDADNLKFWSSIARYHDTTDCSLDFWTSPLNISAAFGIAQLVKRFVCKTEKDGQVFCISSISEALDVAIERGNRDIALSLWRKLRDLDGTPSLHMASRKGYDSLMKEYLQVPSVALAINDQDAHGYSPLLHAAQNGHKAVVELLLQNNAQPDLIDDDGWTALHAACKIGRLDIAELLINRGRADHELRTGAGHNALELAAEGGFEELVAFLLPLYSDTQTDGAERTTSALHLASMYGHTSTCVYLVDHGASINSLDQHMQTPVYLAVLGGFLETVEKLLEAEYPQVALDVDTLTRQEQLASLCVEDAPLREGKAVPSPLQLAAGSNNVEIMELLLEHSHFGTGFMYDRNEALTKAAAEGHLGPVKALLRYTSTTNPVDAEGDTALHVAIRHGHGELVKMLLDSPMYEANFQNAAGLAALHEAAQHGHARIVTTLIDEEWTSEDSTDSHGDKAIHWAVKAGHLDVVKVLQRTKDMSKEKGHDGKTAMVLAALNGHPSIVEEFLSKVQNAVPASDLPWGGVFPLHMAVANKEEELARILISYGYEINLRDVDGDTALHVAARTNSEPLIQLILAKDPDPTIQNHAGETALMVSIKSQNHVASRAILKACAEARQKFINLEDMEENSALYSACEQGDAEMVRLLIENQANPEQDCQRGWKPLHVSAAENRTEIMEILLTANAKVDALNHYGSTAIVLAAESGHATAIRLLVDWKASAKIINSTGSSALHRAAQNGHLDCVKFLIEAGAEINLKKNGGIAPLHLALVHDHDDVAAYLIDLGADVNIESSVIGRPLEIAVGLIMGLYGGSKLESDIVKTLIAKGATMTLTPAQSKRLPEDALVFALDRPRAFVLESPVETLQNAISSEYERAALKMIRSGMDLDETGGIYHTALQAAAAFDSVNIMEELLNREANPNIVGGKYSSALNAAVFNSNLMAVKMLLDKDAKSDIAHEGCLPVHWAVQRRSSSIVEAILDSCADPSPRDQNGRSLLAYAIHWKSDSVFEYLLTRPIKCLDDTDLCGRTALMTAVMLGEQDMVQNLLKNEANPNISDLEGKTPLIRALEAPMANEDILKALLEYGADPSLKDCRGRSWLYWACRRGQQGLVQDLILPALKKNGEISIQGELAFHAIASSSLKTDPDGQRAMLRVLRHPEVEFDLEEQDDDGWTAVYTAMKFGLAVVEDWLVHAMIVYGSHGRHSSRKNPTGWHRQDKASCLEVHEDGRYVQVGRKSKSRSLPEGRQADRVADRVFMHNKAAPLNSDDRDEPFATIRSDHSMPAEEVYYFEVKIELDAPDNRIGVGFCEEHTPLDRILGWDPGSWGYHADDGQFYDGAGYPCDGLSGLKYGKGDTIGCGVNFEREIAFFTKNGQLIGPAFRGIKGKLYPAVSLGTKEAGAAVTVSFSPSEFEYKDWKSEKNTTEQTPEVKEAASPTHTQNADASSDIDAELDWEVEQPQAE